MFCSGGPYWLADSSGRGDVETFLRPPRGPGSDTSSKPNSLLLAALLILARFDIGSRDIVLGFGGLMSPMSTVSTRDSFWSQLDAAAMEVGRVMVAVNM
jgi:hypothetical protein